ncbi:MAG: STAS domain-containing protein [Candidatus Baltobacteraceae bacterium]
MRTITLTGEIDLAQEPQLLELLLTAQGADAVEVDMAGVTYIDSTALRCLIKLKNRMIANGRRGVVRIKNPSGNVARIFRLCNLDKLFMIEEGLRAPLRG